MFRVKNWSTLQSYKDRSPPWIRLHRKLIDNPDFQMMSADARALLPMLWLLACEHDDPTSGIIDADVSKIAWRLRLGLDVVLASINELQVSDFIECIETVTEPYSNRTQTVPPETETETETDINTSNEFDADFDLFYRSYPRKIGKGAARKAFKAARKKTPTIELVAGVKRYIENKPAEIDYCHPATWLNQERWLDEYEVKKAKWAGVG